MFDEKTKNYVCSLLVKNSVAETLKILKKEKIEMSITTVYKLYRNKSAETNLIPITNVEDVPQEEKKIEIKNNFDTIHIPYKKMDKNIKESVFAIMRKGNIVLEKWHDKIKKKLRKCRYPRSNFRKNINDATKNVAKDVVIHGLEIPKRDIEMILAVKSVEWDVLQAHAAMIASYARKFYVSQPSGCTNMDYSSFYQEAVQSAIHAIWCFTKPNIQFSTYLSWCLEHHLYKAVNSNMSLSHLQNSTIALLTEYKAIERSICNDGLNHFEEIVKKMKINKKKINTLQKALNGQLVCESQVPGSSDSDENDGYNQGVIDSDLHPVCQQTYTTEEGDLKLSLEYQELIDKANLNEIEKICLNAWLKSCGNGWKAEIASKMINPNTGASYSRQTPANALKKAQDKVRAIALAA